MRVAFSGLCMPGLWTFRLSKLSVRPHVQGLSKPLSCWSAFNERSENFSPVADSRRDDRVGWSKFGNPWLSDGQLVDWII